jgi:hypothetical protein
VKYTNLHDSIISVATVKRIKADEAASPPPARGWLVGEHGPSHLDENTHPNTPTNDSVDTSSRDDSVGVMEGRGI